MNIDQCIAFLASYGCSKHQVAKVLDIRWESFLEMCKAMPDVKWATRGHTIADKQDRRKTRGKCSEAQRKAVGEAHKARTEAHQVKAFGVLATIEVHAERLGIVSYSAVRKRLKRGMKLEEALTTPPRTRHG